MADLEKTIKVVFGADDQVSGALGNINRKFSEFSSVGSQIGTATQPLANLTDNILKLDLALAALAAGGLYYALKKSIDFENSVVELRKVVGDVPDEIDAATQASKYLALTYGESSARVLEATANFVQAGFNTRDAMALTKNAMDLVIAGSVPAADASEYLISILKGFKAPAEEAARITDILNEVSNKYATNVQELAKGMSTLSPIASMMGFTFEETAGVLTPIIEIFRSGEEAATGLKTGLLKLVSDSKPVKDALAAIGVSQTDANGALRSGKDVLYDVAKAFDSLTEPQKVYFTQELVGIHQSGRMIEIFSNLGKAMEVTAVATKAAGSAQAEVDARLASSEVQIKRVGTAFEEAAISIGDRFKLSLVNGVADPLRDVLEGVRVGIDEGAFDPLFSFIDRVSKDLGEKLKIIAQNLPEALKDLDFSGLIGSLGQLGSSLSGAFKSIFGEIDLTTVEGLHSAIQRIIDGFAALVNVTKGIIDGLRPLFVLIGEGIDQFSSMSEGTADLVGNVLGAAKALNVMAEYAGVLTGAVAVLAGKELVSLISYISKLGGALAVQIPTMTSFASALGMFGGITAAAGIGYTVGSLLEQSEAVQKVAQGFYGLVDANEDFLGAQQITGKELENTNAAFEAARLKHKALTEAQTETTASTVALDSEIQQMITDVGKAAVAMSDMPSEKKITISADTAQVNMVLRTVREVLEDGTISYHEVYVNEPVLAESKAKVDSAFPEKKESEVDVKLDIERIKEQSAVVQKAMEWDARVDIANIESSTKIIASMFDSVNEGIASTGSLISDLLGAYTGAEGFKSSFIEDMIKKEEQRRSEEFRLQKDLIAQQIELMKQKVDAMRRGDMTVKVSADGLQPHLEMILWEVLSAIQVRANADGAEFLLGMA